MLVYKLHYQTSHPPQTAAEFHTKEFDEDLWQSFYQVAAASPDDLAWLMARHMLANGCNPGKASCITFEESCCPPGVFIWSCDLELEAGARSFRFPTLDQVHRDLIFNERATLLTLSGQLGAADPQGSQGFRLVDFSPRHLKEAVGQMHARNDPELATFGAARTRLLEKWLRGVPPATP